MKYLGVKVGQICHGEDKQGLKNPRVVSEPVVHLTPIKKCTFLYVFIMKGEIDTN